MQARELQRKILQIIASFQEGSRDPSATDAQIAENLNLSVKDVRMHLDLMNAEDTVKLVKTAGGYIAILRPRGQITLNEPDYFQKKSFSRNESAASDTNTVSDSGYHLSKIRTLLIEGFSETELRDFCFDTPQFRPVHHELAELTGKAAIARHLLEFADQRELIDQLLIWAKENNPAKFARYQPY